MKLILKKLIPFITALLLLMICGALSKEETAGQYEKIPQETPCIRISTGSGNPNDIPLD